MRAYLSFLSLYVITSKIQKFIKSQRSLMGSAINYAVCNHIKDTKIHQITTAAKMYGKSWVLYVITSKIVKGESRGKRKRSFQRWLCRAASYLM